jgi:hypothetical protein
MQFRVEPSQKPRNPYAALAKNRAAGPHAKPAAVQRHAAKAALKKIDPAKSDD